MEGPLKELLEAKADPNQEVIVMDEMESNLLLPGVLCVCEGIGGVEEVKALLDAKADPNAGMKMKGKGKGKGFVGLIAESGGLPCFGESKSKPGDVATVLRQLAIAKADFNAKSEMQGNKTPLELADMVSRQTMMGMGASVCLIKSVIGELTHAYNGGDPGEAKAFECAIFTEDGRAQPNKPPMEPGIYFMKIDGSPVKVAEDQIREENGKTFITIDGDEMECFDGRVKEGGKEEEEEFA